MSFSPRASANPCSDLCARSSTQTISPCKIMPISLCLFSEQASFFSLSFKVVLIVSLRKSGKRCGVCRVVGVGVVATLWGKQRPGYGVTWKHQGGNVEKLSVSTFSCCWFVKGLVSNDSAKVITCSRPAMYNRGNETISRRVVIVLMLLCQEQMPQKFFWVGGRPVSLTFHNQLQSMPVKMF